MQRKHQDKGIIWNRSKYLAVALIGFLIILTIIIFFSMSGWIGENSKLQQSRTFHIAFGADYGSNAISGSNSFYDFEIDLTMTYPQNTLVVGDTVNIQAFAIIHNQPLNFRVVKIIVGFENAENVPFHQTNNITDSLSMNLLIAQNNQGIVTGQCLWETEGTYHMGINLIGSNSSGTIFFPTVICQNMAVTVYPKTELAQIVTNSASMTLTIALLALTVIGTFSLFFTLWDRNTPAKESKNDGPQSNSQANKNNNKTEIKVDDSKGSTKQTNNQTKTDKK